jgi:hypothetical protein
MGNDTKESAPGIVFRSLDNPEIEAFRQWARDNDTAEHRAKSGLYHPVVREEWARIDAILYHPTTVAVKEYRYDSNHAATPGKFPQFTSIGCYTILYRCADGGELCAACVNGENGSEVGSDGVVYDDGTSDPQWTVVSADMYDEGPTVQCAHCGADIESSYGDPDAFEVKLDNMDRDDGSVLVTCDDRAVKEEHQSIAGSHWEAPRDMSGAYAIICDEPGLVAKLEKEGYNVDSSEYCEPDETTKEEG